MDTLDRTLLTLLQRDATASYAALAAEVGVSSATAHERVRKLRERGVIRRTTVDVDPEAVGLSTVAFVLLRSTAWVGGAEVRTALAAVPEVQEAHIVAGRSSVLVKVRTRNNAHLQAVLGRLYEVDSVSETETVMVLETMFERSVDIDASGEPDDEGSAARIA